jgi:ubiquitin-like modifier-activating enzyme ATG7
MFNVILLQPIPNGTLPGLTSVASGKAVELFARMLHHPDEIHAPGDIAGMETEHQLGLLPHQLRGSLPKCVLSMELGNSFSNCTACSVAVSKFYRMTLCSPI